MFRQKSRPILIDESLKKVWMEIMSDNEPSSAALLFTPWMMKVKMAKITVRMINERTILKFSFM